MTKIGISDGGRNFYPCIKGFTRLEPTATGGGRHGVRQGHPRFNAMKTFGLIGPGDHMPHDVGWARGDLDGLNVWAVVEHGCRPLEIT